MAGITSSHHILGIEHLLGQLGDSDGTIGLGAMAGQGGKPWHEEVEAGEGDKVDS